MVALLVALLMWGGSRVAPPWTMPAPFLRPLAIALICLALAVDLAALREFRRARTTVSPLSPESASTLVRSGVYRWSRNPMYVGLTLLLGAWSLWLGSVWALLGPVALVLYLSRFQIAPEERVLSAKFGADYEAYRAAVRRWL